MATRILSEGSVCISHNQCETLTVKDNTDWEEATYGAWTDPAANITSTSIDLTFDGVTTALTTASYVEEYAIVPADINQSGDTFEDGIYTFSITYADATDDFIFQTKALLTCNIDCQIDEFTHEVATEECSACDDKTELLYCILVYKHALCAAFACNNFDRAEKILAWIESLLVNYNCNNC